MTQNTKFEETKDNATMLCRWEISAHQQQGAGFSTSIPCD